MMVANPRILIVDDMLPARVMMGELFRLEFPRAYGCSACTVFTAENGVDALRLLSEEGPFDIVLTDGSMHRMDGIRLMLEIRSGRAETGPKGTPRNTVICLSTAWLPSEYIDRLGEERFDLILDTIPKNPVSDAAKALKRREASLDQNHPQRRQRNRR